MARSIEKIYGDALFQAAKESGEAERVYGEALRLIAAYEGKEDPAKAVLDLSDTLKGFFALTAEKGRQDLMLPFLKEFSERVRVEKKIGTASVVTAEPLSPEKEKEVRDRLLSVTGYRDLEITYKTEPGIIGGMILTVGDRMLDNSVRTRLRKMTAELSKTVVDKA